MLTTCGGTGPVQAVARRPVVRALLWLKDLPALLTHGLMTWLLPSLCASRSLSLWSSPLRSSLLEQLQQISWTSKHKQPLKQLQSQQVICWLGNGSANDRTRRKKDETDPRQATKGSEVHKPYQREKESQLIRWCKQIETVKVLRCRWFQEAPSREPDKREMVATMISA
jgi:hypothetical protein